jgi:Cu/Ag efflux protein CusF
MRRLSAGLIAAALLGQLSAHLLAQTKELRGQTVTVTATVEAVETATRTITLKLPQGTYVDVVAPSSETKFSEIKVGDQITATYYQNVVLRVKKPGERSADRDTTSGKGAGEKNPAVSPSTQRTITATITAIDLQVPSISFSGPNNWTYSSRVEDRKALQSVKVGDKVDIMWTVALLVSFTEVKK